jgi:hypothetical protein
LKRSKLEEYIAILQILLVHGPLSQTEIQNRTRLTKIDLKKDLVFLLEQEIVEKKPNGAAASYVASPLGARLVSYFGLNAFIKK